MGTLADPIDLVVLDAVCPEALFQSLYRVERLRPLDVLPGPVALGVTHEVAHPSVDLHLEERRAVAVSRPSHRLAGGLVDGDGIVDVDALAAHREAVGPQGAVVDVGHAPLGHADRPVVVLDDEDDRQVVQPREVERLEERPLADRSLAEVHHGDVVGVPFLRPERGTDRGRTALGNDAAAREVHPGIVEVHVSALSLRQPRSAAEDLGGHPSQVDTLRDRDVVRSVWRGHDVVRAEMLADAHGGGLVAGREV